MRRRLVAAGMAVAVAAAAGAASLGAGEPAGHGDECAWGASSVVATLEDGRWVESAPSTSGCVPPGATEGP